MGSILAVAITGFLLLIFSPSEAGYVDEEEGAQQTELVALNAEEADEGEGDMLAQATEETDEQTEEELTEADSLEEGSNEPITRATKDEAVGAFQRLWNRFERNLPKLLIAFGILVFAWLFARFLKWLLPKILGGWDRSAAVITLINIAVWLLAIGLAISVVVGDITAMVGSLGLIGLALSWSLQTPIESFTGWLINSFKGYYRIGDRISVGDVFGDVYRIDFLNTTVWEIGSPYRQGYLQAEQATGRLVTFPNNEVLAGSVVNYTSDFPYVWDELTIAVANESNMRLTMEVLENAANSLLGDYMKEPSERYARILEKAGLPSQVASKPQVFLALDDSWTNVIIRYLVGARERRKWKTELIVLTAEEMGKPEYKGKIISVYPRQQVQLIDNGGMPLPKDAMNFSGDGGDSR